MTVRVAVPTARAGTLPTVATGAVVVPGPGAMVAIGTVAVVMAMRRPGRRVRGLLRRGHRPIIARTPEAHCSVRHI
ncbi:hypothetical protein ACQ86D_25300 [Streptomyces galilaeus]